MILEDNDIRLKDLTFIVDEELGKNEIQIGTNTSAAYLIKPIHTIKKVKEIIVPTAIVNDEKDALLRIDNAIHLLGKRLILGNILKPLNYLDELDIFITKKGKYNPQFTYKRPKNEVLAMQQQHILEYKDELEHRLHSPIKKIFIEKCEELLYRVKLIQAYKKQDFKEILFYNTKIFGSFSQEYIDLAKGKSFETESDPKVLGAYLSLSQIRKEVEHLLSKKGFSQTDIIVSSTNLSRISIVK